MQYPGKAYARGVFDPCQEVTIPRLYELSLVGGQRMIVSIHRFRFEDKEFV